MTAEFFLLFAIGFFAQLVDGALGMAYGVLTNTALLSIGHAAGAGERAGPHRGNLHHRRVRRRRTSITAMSIGAYVSRLGVRRRAGAVLGAWILSTSMSRRRAATSTVYLLLMGIYILWQLGADRADPRASGRNWHGRAGRLRRRLPRCQRRRRLGTGLDLDAGRLRTSAAAGVGSVNTAEFFVTVRRRHVFCRARRLVDAACSCRSFSAAFSPRRSAAGWPSECRRGR